MDLKFRDLKADEIECRVAQVSREGKGFSLLLYKDSRVDMNVLDETVGAMNWQRSHTRENANCIVSIWDEEKKVWVSKEDTGTESNTEALKGLASDSFKRSCFCWGIGRELYTAPFIWVKDGDPKKDRFAVESITIENKRITALVIKNEKTGDIVYTFGKTSAKKTTPKKTTEPKAEAPKTVAKTAPEEKKEEPKKAKFPNRNEFIKFCQDNDLVTADICNEYKEQNAEKGIEVIIDNSTPDDFFVDILVFAKDKVYGSLPFPME